MKRSVRHIFGFLFAAAGSALLLGVAPGCAENESTLFIRQAQIPQPVSGGSSCKVEASASATFRGHGTLDVAIAPQYVAHLLIGNQMVDRGSRDDLKTETSRVQLEGSEVYLTDASGRQIAGPYTVPGAGFIDPASGSNPSYGLLDTVLVDSVTVSKLKSELSALPRGTIRRLTAHVKAFGTTVGGIEVDSGEWSFPIDACYGCLVSYPSEAANPALQMPNCGGSDVTNISKPCHPGQDDPVDCRICKAVAPTSGVCEPNGE